MKSNCEDIENCDRIKKLITLIFVFYLSFNFTFGQTIFQNIYDGDGNTDYLTCTYKTLDNGFITAGVSYLSKIINNVQTIEEDIIIIKFDQNGNKIIGKTFDFRQIGIQEYPKCIFETEDGNYIYLVGTLVDTISNKQGTFLARLDPNTLDIINSVLLKSYDSENNYSLIGEKMIEKFYNDSTAPSLVLVGKTEYVTLQDDIISRAFLIELPRNLSTISAEYIYPNVISQNQENYFTNFKSIKQIEIDGIAGIRTYEGFIVVGTTLIETDTNNYSDMWLLNLSPVFYDVVWSKKVAQNSNSVDYGYDIEEIDKGSSNISFIATGKTSLNGQSFSKLLMLSFDRTSCSINWFKTLGSGNNYNYSQKNVKTDTTYDSNIIVTSLAEANNNISFMLSKIDATNGNALWSRIINRSQADIPYDVIELNNYNLVAVGGTQISNNQCDGFIISTNDTGYTCMYDEDFIEVDSVNNISDFDNTKLGISFHIYEISINSNPSNELTDVCNQPVINKIEDFNNSLNLSSIIKNAQNYKFDLSKILNNTLENLNIEIFNLLGEQISKYMYSTKFIENQLFIETKNMLRGYYIVKINNSMNIFSIPLIIDY